MFAVIKTGGKQYKVSASDVITIERLPGEAGDTVAFSDVLMVGGEKGTTIGAPTVAGATVAGEIVRHDRGERLIAFKKRRRQNSKRKRGHRQDLTVVRISDILTDGAKPKPAKKAAKPKAEKAAEPKAEKAAKPAAEPEKETAPAPKKAKPAEAPEAGADDLKRITGVGKVLEGKLHALGIVSFAQIAAWSADDVARIDDELNFKGRIERDGWVDQAKAFLAEKD